MIFIAEPSGKSRYIIEWNKTAPFSFCSHAHHIINLFFCDCLLHLYIENALLKISNATSNRSGKIVLTCL